MAKLRLQSALSTSQVSSFVTSDAVIVAGSAILVAPLVLGFVQRFIAKTPFLATHFTLGFAVAGFLVWFLSARMLSGKIKMVGIGVGAGLFIVAITPVFNEQVATRLRI